MVRPPSFVPPWTDHNDSDPGVTLLELLVVLCACLFAVAAGVRVRQWIFPCSPVSGPEREG